MKRTTRITRSAATIIGIGILAMTLTAQDKIPPLDKNAPKVTQTATFALG